MTLRSRALAVAGAALTTVAFAGPANAATPETGTLKVTEPTLEWTGESFGSAVQYAHFFYGEQLVDDCVAPNCDTFTLTLADKGKLEIGAEDATGYTEMQIKDASGTEIFWSEGVESGPTVFKQSNVPAGTYTVEILTDALAPELDDGSYSGYAKLNDGKVPPPAPAP